MIGTRPLQALARRIFTFDAGTHTNLVGGGDPSAIAIDGDPAKPSLLAFHGFAGTPREVAVVTSAAARVGLTARAPRLAGHTSNVGDLMNVGFRDWEEQAKRELVDLDARASAPGKRTVVVAGLSFGALLATHLAAVDPARVRGLIVLANATWLRFSTFRLPLGILERLEPFDNRFFIPKHGSDIRDPVARSAHVTYELNPVKSAIEVLRAARLVRGELGRVRCPTLVIHGRLDQVCPVANATWFAENLGTADVEIRIMPRSGHIVTVDADRDDVARAVEGFLRRVSG